MPKATEQIPITSLPEEGAREEGPPPPRSRRPSARVRRHVAAVRAADAEATRLERLLRRQGTVDTVQGDEREQARFSEVFIAVLLRLDAVPGPCRTRRPVIGRRSCSTLTPWSWRPRCRAVGVWGMACF